VHLKTLDPSIFGDVEMKTTALTTLAALAAAAGLALSPAAAQTAAPKLAEGVKPQAAYEPMTKRFYVALPGSIHTDILWTSPSNGELELNDTVDAIAKVKDWDWVVVGRNGVGVGYVPIDRLSSTPIRR